MNMGGKPSVFRGPGAEKDDHVGATQGKACAGIHGPSTPVAGDHDMNNRVLVITNSKAVIVVSSQRELTAVTCSERSQKQEHATHSRPLKFKVHNTKKNYKSCTRAKCVH